MRYRFVSHLIAASTLVGVGLVATTVPASASTFGKIVPTARSAQALMAACVECGVSLKSAATAPEWKFIPSVTHPGFYTIRVRSESGAFGFLDVSGDSTEPGGVMVIRPFDQTPSQLWKPVRQAAGGKSEYRFQNLYSKLFMRVEVGAGTFVRQRKLSAGGENTFSAPPNL
ncbi:hypothetical protein GA0070611_0644 [Micromonospora auratinigra]|uniref:Ricin B lectin domain-containing protein n=2 Tax=Micromonospora auratinigra TaxID=261654 RepID=A0A1A8Z4B4_9ACTN|nr:hypothetical protein GA0070611_0644 [Micromonospora auratinigra]